MAHDAAAASPTPRSTGESPRAGPPAATTLATMVIRPERTGTAGDGDAAAIRAVHTAAFRAPGTPGEVPVEATLVDHLRADAGWLPRLSLVAVVDGDVVGHVVCTRGWVATPGGDRAALGLGPLGVVPEHQGGGVGSALVHAVLGAADALDEPLVALLGDPGYYRRFGFVPARTLGVESPDPAWGDHFQARPLAAYDPALVGGFRYAAPFTGL